MADLSYLLNNDPNRFRITAGQPTMKAVVTTGNGGYEKLNYCEVPIPSPGAGEVSTEGTRCGRE